MKLLICLLLLANVAPAAKKKPPEAATAPLDRYVSEGKRALR